MNIKIELTSFDGFLDWNDKKGRDLDNSIYWKIEGKVIDFYVVPKKGMLFNLHKFDSIYDFTKEEKECLSHYEYIVDKVCIEPNHFRVYLEIKEM